MNRSGKLGGLLVLAVATLVVATVGLRPAVLVGLVVAVGIYVAAVRESGGNGPCG